MNRTSFSDKFFVYLQVVIKIDFNMKDYFHQI